MNTRQRVLLLIGLAILIGGSVVWAKVRDADAAKADAQSHLQVLLTERADSAAKAYDAMNAAFEAENVTLDTLIDAANKLVAAELAVATKPEATIAAWQRHVDRMRDREQKIKALYDLGSRGGEVKEYFSIKREHENAQISLLEAKMRAER